ncbi:hypothetical protein LXA43DRAFT_1048456 [Ganoderma leucocontextum]|nr:hypothetical protein LXA43DRAFT_1048456 [Ganoderma leucocontextum]
MDKCPNEILSLIFAEACTDDGLTGRSLSLVSRRTRDTSRRYALQSVALYGSYQLSAFASLLDKADLEDRHVCHLYLTDRRRVWMEYLPGQDREEWLTERMATDFHVNDPWRKYSFSAIQRILKTVAPTVQTLTLLLFDRYDEQPLSDAVPFPKLRDLTIHGSNMTHAVHSELPQCMSLRRLHVIHDYDFRKPITKAVSWLSPLLTHLRISRLVLIPIVSSDLLRGLERMLQHDDLASTAFPPTLKRVLVQMLPQGLYDKNGYGVLRMFTLPMVYQLRDVAMRDVRRRIVFLKPGMWNPAEAMTGENSDVHFYMGIKAAWEQRMVESESTVWDVDPPSVLASYGYCAEGEYWDRAVDFSCS